MISPCSGQIPCRPTTRWPSWAAWSATSASAVRRTVFGVPGAALAARIGAHVYFASRSDRKLGAAADPRLWALSIHLAIPEVLVECAPRRSDQSRASGPRRAGPSSGSPGDPRPRNRLRDRPFEALSGPPIRPRIRPRMRSWIGRVSGPLRGGSGGGIGRGLFWIPRPCALAHPTSDAAPEAPQVSRPRPRNHETEGVDGKLGDPLRTNGVGNGVQGHEASPERSDGKEMERQSEVEESIG